MKSWYEEQFGPVGDEIRDNVLEIVQNCHSRLSNAQDTSEMGAKLVYGTVWKAALEDFLTQLMKFPGAQKVVPAGANYSLVAIGDTVFFPWRFGRDPFQNLEDATFAVSNARIRIFSTPFKAPHPELDLGIYPTAPPTSGEEDQGGAREGELRELMTRKKFRVVVVGFSSRPGLLHSVDWGQATLGVDGHLIWGHHERLLEAGKATMTVVDDQTAAFNEGELPEKFVAPKEKQAGRDD